MKKTITLIALLLAISSGANAQDILTKKNGEELEVKITEISKSQVKYTLFESPTGPTYVEEKADLLMVKFENGKKEVFTSTTSDAAPATAEGMYFKGQMDAKENYKKYTGAGTGTFFTSLIAGPLLGLIPAIACSSKEPSIQNLGYTNADLMKNAEYNRGYVEAAKKKKSGKVWKNYGIGAGIALVASIIIISSSSTNTGHYYYY